MTGEPLTPEEVEFLDKYSGTTPLPADEVEQILAAGRALIAAAQYPDVPHIDEIIAAFPSEHLRLPFEVAAFIENGTIDHPENDDEVIGVREWLESGGAPEPVLEIVRYADQWGI